MRVLQYPDNMMSKFKFVAVAGHRCRQLQKGARPRVNSRSKKFTTIAQEEVLADLVPYSEGPAPQVAEPSLGDTVDEIGSLE